MKAMLLTGHGGPDMLRYGDAPDPTPAPGEIVVDVHAASVNAADYKVRLGGRGYDLRFPYILGRDFSGVVAKAGEGVADFAIGDPVFGVMDAGIEGAYAEKLTTRAAIVARKPDRLSHLQAAAMALIGITAIWAIEDTAQLQAGETILIQGGAGGVAGFAIQLAKYLGATVVTTTSAANVDYVRSTRSRPRGRLQRRGFHQGRFRLRRGVRHGRGRRSGALVQRLETRWTAGLGRTGAGWVPSTTIGCRCTASSCQA